VSTIRRQFKACNLKYKVAPRNCHLKMGDPAFILPALAKSLRAQLLVMGAISRSVIRRAIVGSTAEKVLDSSPCDILIVKPGSRAPKR
jgi:universal stress protein E